jgi:peptide/nickel transport system permease protein
VSESLSEVPQAAGSQQVPYGPAAAPLAVAPIGGAAGLGGPAAGFGGGLGGGTVVGRKRSDLIYYGLRNKKLIFGLSLELLLVLFAIIGPMIAKYGPQEFTGAQLQHPNGTYWLGTNTLGQDIFSQLANGIRESYLIGALGAVSAAVVGMALGFTAGWRGGILDEILQMITNIIVMLPSLVLLVVIGSYMTSKSILFEGIFIGLTTWPWVARAVRAQTFSLRSREFVEMAKLSGKRPLQIIVRDIAPYLFLVVILLFGSSMLIAASYDFLGLGPTGTVSLGTMMNQAQNEAALLYHEWWWFIPPGAVLTGMVVALLVANVGLDEIFNPKLREQ